MSFCLFVFRVFSTVYVKKFDKKKKKKTDKKTQIYMEI